MSGYRITGVSPSDLPVNRQIDALLRQEGIRRDKSLDYTCAVTDDRLNVVATGSCFGNTLRCLAVAGACQGEGLLNLVATHLIEKQQQRGNFHLFLYTKGSTAKFFRDLGFYEIAQIDQELVFMENRRTGFADYLKRLSPCGNDRPCAAIVLNANPFTLGHLYLVETAARENELVHLFMVSEDASLIPYPVRKQLILEGTAHLENLRYHDTGPYLISSATFPSYFQRDEQAVIRGQARLDAALFVRIAKALCIRKRYLGEEPASLVTGIYNEILKADLGGADIDCVVLKRRQLSGEPISASTARQALKDGDWTLFRRLVPDSTYRYFTSDRAAESLARIRRAEQVVHY